MHIALICLDDPSQAASTDKTGNPWKMKYASQCASLERDYTLAIARHMRDGGRLAPVLICRKKSRMEAQAKDLNLPALAAGNQLAALTGFWRWQRKFPSIMIFACGMPSLTFAKRAIGVCGKKDICLCSAMFLRSPEQDSKCGKELCRANHCLCGSAHIEARVRDILEKNPPKKHDCRPEIEICEPGMDLEPYSIAAKPYVGNSESDEHFVFGMADSLLPRSGALLVVRAMAAIWQKEDLPPWEVRMFGSGPRFQEVLSEAQNMGVASRLSILSEQPLAQMSRACHAWLAPGSSPDELPEVLWCGLVSGLPVICSQSPLHKERMQMFSGNAALKVDQNNPQELARAMIGVMRDARLRQRLVDAAMAGRKHVGLDALAARICARLEDWLPPSPDSEKSA